MSFAHIDLQQNKWYRTEQSMRRRVKEIASQTEATIKHLNATMPDLLLGYRVKILDGNAICVVK